MVSSKDQGSLFLYVHPVAAGPFIKKTFLSTLNYLDTFVGNQLSVCGSISGLSILFHSLTCLSFTKDAQPQLLKLYRESDTWWIKALLCSITLTSLGHRHSILQNHLVVTKKPAAVQVDK